MTAHKHFRDASAWIAKAPPLTHTGASALGEAVVLQFPAERIKRGRDIGLAGGCTVLRPSRSQAWRWPHRGKGQAHAG